MWHARWCSWRATRRNSLQGRRFGWMGGCSVSRAGLMSNGHLHFRSVAVPLKVLVSDRMTEAIDRIWDRRQTSVAVFQWDGCVRQSAKYDWPVDFKNK